MKVIYAGFPKTGTKTMADALTILGYKCYDIMENYEYLGEDWMEIFNRGGTVEDFRRMFKDVDAVMDSPCCYFWEDILEAFPETKVIIRYRSEEHWLESTKKQMESYERWDVKILNILSPSFRKFERWMNRKSEIIYGSQLQIKWFSNYHANRTLLKKAYRLHNSYVKQHVPKNQLHVIKFEQGWEPLCQFLHLPIPDVPFPHRNKCASITEETISNHPLFHQCKTEAGISIIFIGIIAAIFIAFLCG